ncbi:MULTISPECIES: DUF2505 domain-containing protein [unclassified Mycolicibacterium]|uniref:DUF2505 domain-containing protein n=1 Tax=unclassified Mycolicibacterium TaxID=2636767 RepID=UPI001F4C04A5|nr:DUF2505 domain-containing protein [Mycolicibacterium sp. YH-1]UNB53464.1 DUF2505 domain-containing protein [Mycolicibacterium sp. YH-1]
MSRSFDFSVNSPATVEQIHHAFGERAYWLARLETFGGLGSLDSLTVDSDGAVTAVVVKEMHHDKLPGPAAKFFPREWRVVQNETWSPIGDGRVRGQVSVVPDGAPGSGAGTALLAPTPNGSHMKCTATVQFRVPMIGGAVEGIMGRLLVQNISAMQRFTTAWIQERV